MNALPPRIARHLGEVREKHVETDAAWVIVQREGPLLPERVRALLGPPPA